MKLEITQHKSSFYYEVKSGDTVIVCGQAKGQATPEVVERLELAWGVRSYADELELATEMRLVKGICMLLACVVAAGLVVAAYVMM